MRLDDWFLGADERGNPSASLHPWTEGNDVTALVHGARYFERLCDRVSSTDDGDEVRFTDWRGDGDEKLADDGPTVAALFAAASARGVDLRGLLWRSHSDLLSFSKKENRRFAKVVDQWGGEVLLDERVRRGGSHHQKLVIVRRADPAGDVAFVGGIDLSHGRRDDAVHAGDEQAIEIDQRYGTRPPWHDIQLEVRGRAVGDLDRTFRERWDDPTPLDHEGRLRAAMSRATSSERCGQPLPPPRPDPPRAGSHAVQVLRTYPVRRPAYPFAPRGERSVARAFAKAVGRARRLVYIEDQYFWSSEMAEVLAGALRRHPTLQVIAVVPRIPDKDGRASGPPGRIAQERAMEIVRRAGGDRVGFFDLENDSGTPVYVHAKACVIDDVWATIGSDNLNRRSWTHDSELACAVIDETRDEREPRDPGGLGDGARRFARELRLELWAEHLRTTRDDPSLLELEGAVDRWRAAAQGGGRVRFHRNDPVPRVARPWAELVNRLVYDPDGRTWRDRRRHRY